MRFLIWLWNLMPVFKCRKPGCAFCPARKHGGYCCPNDVVQPDWRGVRR